MKNPVNQPNTIEDVIRYLVNLIAEEFNVDPEGIDIDKEFVELGFDSVNALVILDRIEKEFKLELNTLYFWDYPTVRSFAEQIFKDITNKP